MAAGKPMLSEASTSGASTSCSASSSSGSTEVPPPAGAVNLLEHIERLRVEKRRLKEERRLLTKTLKNAEKRKSRLKKRARQLSDQDLVDVLQLRHTASAGQTGATASAPGPAPPESVGGQTGPSGAAD